jgi:hypothetical protein
MAPFLIGGPARSNSIGFTSSLDEGLLRTARNLR